MQSDTINSIKELTQPIVEQRNMFLVDIELKHQKMPEIWVLVDSEEDGVDLGKCSEISRELGVLMEESDLISGSFRLNVSSPGLSRPLSDIRQYKKNIGRLAKVKYKQDEEYLTAEGVIDLAGDELFTVLHSDGKRSDIQYQSVIEAKIIPKI
jgi:ribosome maturation factor RimP